MKYACLCYDEEKILRSMSRDEQEAIIREVQSLNEQLRKKGKLISAEALDWVDSATTVRVHNGRISTTDGPFAETKEQLGGFYLIEARDLNEAVQLASRLPGARIGCVEVRPVIDLFSSGYSP